jgi:hypothetical protein
MLRHVVGRAFGTVPRRSATLGLVDPTESSEKPVPSIFDISQI